MGIVKGRLVSEKSSADGVQEIEMEDSTSSTRLRSLRWSKMSIRQKAEDFFLHTDLANIVPVYCELPERGELVSVR